MLMGMRTTGARWGLILVLALMASISAACGPSHDRGHPVAAPPATPSPTPSPTPQVPDYVPGPAVVYPSGRTFIYENAATGQRVRVGRTESPVGFSAWSLTAANRRVFWVQRLVGRPGHDRWIILADRVGSVRPRLIYGPTPHDMGDVLALGDYVYWAGDRWLGRVHIDGTQAQPHYIKMPRQNQIVPFEDGFATDGMNLYFSQSQNDRVGEVSLAQSTAHPQVRWITGIFCPGSIAISGHELYWARSGGNGIGRVDLVTGQHTVNWLRTRWEAVDVAVAGRYVYWVSDVGLPPGRTFLGRAGLDRTDQRERFRVISDDTSASATQ